MMQIEHADGSVLFISGGAANLPKGASVADVAREDWLRLYEPWPQVEGRLDDSDPPI